MQNEIARKILRTAIALCEAKTFDADQVIGAAMCAHNVSL